MNDACGQLAISDGVCEIGKESLALDCHAITSCNLHMKGFVRKATSVLHALNGGGILLQHLFYTSFFTETFPLRVHKYVP